MMTRKNNSGRTASHRSHSTVTLAAISLSLPLRYSTRIYATGDLHALSALPADAVDHHNRGIWPHVRFWQKAQPSLTQL